MRNLIFGLVCLLIWGTISTFYLACIKYDVCPFGGSNSGQNSDIGEVQNKQNDKTGLNLFDSNGNPIDLNSAFGFLSENPDPVLPESFDQISDGLSNLFEKIPGLKMEIKGLDNDSEQLGLARAESLMNLLREKGLDSLRISALTDSGDYQYDESDGIARSAISFSFIDENNNALSLNSSNSLEEASLDQGLESADTDGSLETEDSGETENTDENGEEYASTDSEEIEEDTDNLSTSTEETSQEQVSETPPPVKNRTSNSGNIKFTINYQHAHTKPSNSRGFRDFVKEGMEMLNSGSASHFQVIGHTDQSGTDKTNSKISARRAERVKNLLGSLGVPRSKIKVSSLGPDSPVADNDSEEGRRKNRRVEVVIN